jgi:hypothetical protein
VRKEDLSIDILSTLFVFARQSLETEFSSQLLKSDIAKKNNTFIHNVKS